MSEKVLMKGNEALASPPSAPAAASSSDIPSRPRRSLPPICPSACRKKGGTYLQAESEIAAINMVYGASAAGARVMTSSSSPGISLKTEGHLLHDRRGPAGRHHQRPAWRPRALGGIQPSQSDYWQGDPCARSRRRPDHRACAVYRSGDGRPRLRCVRPGRPIPHAGHDLGGRHARPDDGAGRSPRAPRQPAGEAVGGHWP